MNPYWRHIQRSNLFYSDATGLLELKIKSSNYLNISRTIKCNYEQIVMTSGSLQFLYRIATSRIEKGDSVILENILIFNVHSIFKNSKTDLSLI